MRKTISILLALLSFCVFTASASAESQTDGSGTDAAASSADAVQTTTEATTETTQPTTQPTSAAQAFAGMVMISFEAKPVNTELPVTVTVEGGTLSEGDKIRYRMYAPTVSDADADPEIVWTDYTQPVMVRENTVFEAAIFFADGSRSSSAVSAVECIDTVLPESPQLQASSTEWTKDPITVSLSGGSDEHSGLLRLEYRLGADGTWAEYTDIISISGNCEVYARSVDKAGNLSSPTVLQVSNFDLTAPDVAGMKLTLSAEGAPVVAESGAFGKYYGSPVTVRMDGAADSESGVASYQYQTVGGTDSVSEDKWQKYDPENPPVIPGDFCGFVYGRAVDNVGNCSSAVASEGFVVDVTPPEITNIELSETKITGNRVIVTFDVTDNYWLETVMVNGVYAGVYAPSFTAFRNDKYLIVAYDKVGNRIEETVEITNINTTPFTLLDTWKGMNSEDFTPSTWNTAELAALELQTLITVETGQAQIDAAAGKLLTALEGLVPRGDGTLSRELIQRLSEYDTTLYTESSWAKLQETIAALEEVLDDPESTQETVDSGRRALEQRVTELVKRADFTDLDRLIAQCERLDTDGFSKESCKVFTDALTQAKELSRTDSGQNDADAAYSRLLAAMGSLEVKGEKALNVTPIVFVVLGLLIIATATALFIVRMRAKSQTEYDGEEEDGGEYYDDGAEEYPTGYGDIQFTDEDYEDYDDDSDSFGESDDDAGYIGRR